MPSTSPSPSQSPKMGAIKKRASPSQEAGEDGGNRKRVTKACDRCRLKKSKCDGQSHCNRCAQENTFCNYGERRFLKEKVHPKGYTDILEQDHKRMCRIIQELGNRLEAAGQMPGPTLRKNPDGYPFVQDVGQRVEGENFTFGSPLADKTFDEDPELIHEEMMRQQNLQEETSRQETAAQYPTPAIAYPAMAPPAMVPPAIGRVEDPNGELSPSHFLDELNRFSPESLNPASMNMTFPTVPESSNYVQQFHQFNQINSGYDWTVNLSAEDTYSPASLSMGPN